MSNFSFTSSSGEYRDPTLGDKNSFLLTYRDLLIFERQIESNNPNVVKIPSNNIIIADHFYSTGEELTYNYSNEDVPIGIASTIISGISTSYLPQNFYVVKISNIEIKVSATAEDALSVPPKTLTLTSLGVGQHKFISKNQNTKCLIALDNIVQSPILSTGTTGQMTNTVDNESSSFQFDEIGQFKGGDLIKIDDEYMRIFSVGIGSTEPNKVRVERPILGSISTPHYPGSLVTKLEGNFNIVDNIIYFVSAPYGNELSTLNENISGSDIEYSNLDIRSKFNGRVFLRSGIPFGSEETYAKNYLFDSLSNSFDGYTRSFTLTSNGENISEFSTNNSIILINDILQTPSRLIGDVLENDFILEETSGISSISFVGTSASVSYDVNTTQLPRGGIIFSIGSTEGFGYHPLVSAGGTAVVSISGTIQSISIGNSGSGYRTGIQTSVRVGVQTQSNIEYIGIASIQNGHVISINIINSGYGYTSSNPPRVIFDAPLSYWNIPLQYSSSSSPGLGTEATIDIIVGQESNIIQYDIRNLGFGYKSGEILTIPTGGITGIPTNIVPEFEEFKIYLDEIKNDEFNGWTLGELQLLDNIDSLFDNERKVFPISINDQRISIRGRIGSNIDITATLILTVNNILQVPYKSYRIRGGSLISFTEPPRKGDKCRILFYRGTTNIDTRDADILETIKEGDDVRIYDRNRDLDEYTRSVEEILTSDTIRTNTYGGPGITQNQDLRRPLIWCRQTEDKFIGGKSVTKDRIIYEPIISPETYLIQPVSTSSTVFFVQNVKTFFDSSYEYENSEGFQDKIIILSQKNLRPATSVPSISNDSISNLIIVDGGVGYTTNPTISVSSPVGIGQTCTATTTINQNGEITSINIINNGSGYDSSNIPNVIIEEPTFTYEIIDEVLYEGDFGNIVGVSTTTIGVSSLGLNFDLLIPTNSYIRNENFSRVGIASTGISGIKTGYYFSISNSNIGNIINSLNNDGISIGISTQFMDNIYQVYDYNINQKNILGVGITYVNTITVKVNNYTDIVGASSTNYFGEYSWGKLYNLKRYYPKEFESYPVGITSSSIVRRYKPLKYLNYVT